jgi:copper oxidase (laccase) domain-containing protein
MFFATAEQVHGKEIALVSGVGRRKALLLRGRLVLVTDQPGISLGVYVADCCAVFLVDPVRNAVGLVHFREEGNRALDRGRTRLAKMQAASRLRSARSRSSSSVPAIRPPHYEIDFAAEIMRQFACCRECNMVHDAVAAPPATLRAYYSYRAERKRRTRQNARPPRAGVTQAFSWRVAKAKLARPLLANFHMTTPFAALISGGRNERAEFTTSSWRSG